MLEVVDKNVDDSIADLTVKKVQIWHKYICGKNSKDNNINISALI